MSPEDVSMERLPALTMIPSVPTHTLPQLAVSWNSCHLEPDERPRELTWAWMCFAALE